jgi:hypothetical protein
MVCSRPLVKSHRNVCVAALFCGRSSPLIGARVASRRNDDHEINSLTHFGRAMQKLIQEWFVYHDQPRLSGDDMNIIQVGRPAVSRYHQSRSFWMDQWGPNHKIHDFPSSEMGVKLGGFMILWPRAGTGRPRSVSL